MCWRCTAALGPSVPQTTSSVSNIPLVPQQLLQFHLQRMVQMNTQRQQQLQPPWPPSSPSQLQQAQSLPFLQQMSLIQRQQQILQQRQSQAHFPPWGIHAYNSGVGTSSNPISIGDSPPLIRTPPIPSLPQLTPPVLNGGWPTGFPNPFTSQPARDPSHYLQSYDYHVPNPSAEEIKDLLANIRPDEDIKVEDKDAIIAGMAPHMRLMKHQQVVLYFMV